MNRSDGIKDEFIKRADPVGLFGEKGRETRLKWFGHACRRDDIYVGKRNPTTELPGKEVRRFKMQ